MKFTKRILSAVSQQLPFFLTSYQVKSPYYLSVTVLFITELDSFATALPSPRSIKNIGRVTDKKNQEQNMNLMIVFYEVSPMLLLNRLINSCAKHIHKWTALWKTIMFEAAPTPKVHDVLKRTNKQPSAHHTLVWASIHNSVNAFRSNLVKSRSHEICNLTSILAELLSRHLANFRTITFQTAWKR